MIHQHRWAAIVFLAMFLSYGFNFFGFSSDRQVKNFQIDSQAYTLGKIAAVVNDPFSTRAWLSPACLPPGETRKIRDQLAHTNFPDTSCTTAYTGNPSIHAVPLAWFASLTHMIGADGAGMIAAMRLLSAMLASFVATWIVMSVMRMYGATAALGAAIGLAGSTFMIMMAPNLYWFPATLMLPAAFAAHELAQGRSPTSLRFVTILSLLLVLRFLSGFEFITNVLLSVAVVWMAAPRTHTGGIARAVREALVGAAVFIGATVTAMGLHLILIASNVGGLAAAWDNFLTRVLKRTGDFGQEIQEVYKASLSADRIDVLLSYLLPPTAILGFSFGFIICITLMMILLGKLAGRKALPALALTAVAVAASVSWHLFAKGHSYIHHTINHVLSALPALPILLAISADRFVACLEFLAKRLRTKSP